MRHSFCEMINRERLPPIRDIAEIMYDPVKAYESVLLSSIFFVDMKVRNSKHYN